jgi:hypothetical protein
LYEKHGKRHTLSFQSKKRRRDISPPIETRKYRPIQNKRPIKTDMRVSPIKTEEFQTYDAIRRLQNADVGIDRDKQLVNIAGKRRKSSLCLAMFRHPAEEYKRG